MPIQKPQFSLVITPLKSMGPVLDECVRLRFYEHKQAKPELVMIPAHGMIDHPHARFKKLIQEINEISLGGPQQNLIARHDWADVSARTVDLQSLRRLFPFICEVAVIYCSHEDLTNSTPAEPVSFGPLRPIFTEFNRVSAIIEVRSMTMSGATAVLPLEELRPVAGHFDLCLVRAGNKIGFLEIAELAWSQTLQTPAFSTR